MPKLRKIIFCHILALGGITVCAPHAQAQAVLVPMKPLNMDREALDRLRTVPVSTQSIAEVRSQVGGASAATSVALTAAAGLSSFKLQYHNGDHGVRVVSTLKRPDGMADIRLHNANSDDPFGGYASWWLIPGAIGGEVSGSGRSNGFVDMPVPAGPADHVLALGGFSVEISGTRTNFDVGDTQISRIEFVAKDTTTRPSIDATIRTSDDRPIRVKAQYVWIPRNMITGVKNLRNETMVRGGGPFVGGATRGDQRVRTVADAQGQDAGADKYVIKSFNLEFTNGVHNLLNIGVHLNGERGASGEPEAVSWQDNNRDDPIRWQVNFYNVR